MLRVKETKSDLESFIEDSNWNFIRSTIGNVGVMTSSVVGINFQQASKEPDKVKNVVIRFGHEIIKSLDWKDGDRIGIYNHPDDLLCFMLVKNMNGYILQNENPAALMNTGLRRLSFVWKQPLKLKPAHTKLVKHEIYKGKNLVFRAENIGNDK